MPPYRPHCLSDALRVTDTGPIYPGRQPHPELTVGVRVTHSEYGDGTLIGMCTSTWQ